jgi:hypothetical protein
MNPEQSPFKPGQIVPFEFFVGRIEEIERLLSMVKASTQGQFKIGFISGERGIGKSSLASLVRHVSDSNHNTAGCHVHLGGVGELNEMVRTTFDRLLNESIDKSWHQQMKDFFGSRVQKVGLFGISLELNLTDKDLPVLSRNFVPSMKNLLDKLNEQKDALLLILDDINGLATSTDFANWLKSMVDEISTSEQEMPLCILVVGLEERRQELIEGQPSLARVFELIDISPWSDDETSEFYQNAFQSMNAKIGEPELSRLVQFTGGLPVLAHEIGDAVWRAAQSLEINAREVSQGIFIAAEIIGRKLLEPQIFRAIRSERYRSILRKMAGESQMYFRRAELVANLTEKEAKVVGSFLRRMKKLGAIETIDGVRGGYKFPTFLHALYFRLESEYAKD